MFGSETHPGLWDEAGGFDQFLIFCFSGLNLNMAFYSRIPTRYLANVPALFLAGIAAFDILSDVITHKLTPINFSFNLLLCIPLLLRYYMVYVIYGTLISMFAAYVYIAEFVWFVQYLNGTHFSYPFETFVIGPIFATLTFISGLSFFYVARRLSQKW